MIAMWESGHQLDAEARDEKAGIKKSISRLVEKKRAERLAREAKQKKGR